MVQTLGIWSQVVEPGKPFSYSVPQTVQLTSAAFDEDVKSDGKRSVVKLRYSQPILNPEEDEDDEDEEEEERPVKIEEKTAVLCHLVPGRTEHQVLDLTLPEESAVEISVTGPNKIHLLGRFIDEETGGPDYDRPPYGDEFDSDDDESDEEGELGSDDIRALMAQNGILGGPDGDSDDEMGDASRFQELEDEKAGLQKDNKQNKLKEAEKLVAAAQGKKRQRDEPDVAASKAAKTKQGSTAPAAAKDKKDTAASATTPTEEVDVSKLSKNQRKKLKKAKQGEDGGAAPSDSKPAAANGTGEGKKNKKESEGNKANVDKPQEKKKVTLPSGVSYEDAKTGAGDSAKHGKLISMRYIGKLANGKVFDSNTKGAPFKFKLGMGEVIKGWDEGIKGMSIGGERVLTIPASAGYGKRGAPPDIPPNAELRFEVKLLGVS